MDRVASEVSLLVKLPMVGSTVLQTMVATTMETLYLLPFSALVVSCVDGIGCFSSAGDCPACCMLESLCIDYDKLVCISIKL